MNDFASASTRQSLLSINAVSLSMSANTMFRMNKDENIGISEKDKQDRKPHLKHFTFHLQYSSVSISMETYSLKTAHLLVLINTSIPAHHSSVFLVDNSGISFSSSPH